MIVGLLSVFAQSEAVHHIHFCPVLLQQGSRKRHRLRPPGCSDSGTWMHLHYGRYSGLGMDGLVMGCSRMNIIIVWAKIFW